MKKKSIAKVLILVMMLSFLSPFSSLENNNVSFAATNDYYEYNPGDKVGQGYYYNDGTGKVTDNSGNVLFSDLTEGYVMVQDFDVSDIGWLSGNNHLWTRSNMFREDRVENTYRAVTATRNSGYGNGSDDYYKDYVFYTQANWNGNKEQGGMAKTARKIWGYYTADRTGYYQFKVSTDDGHYINFYQDDIFFNPKYDRFNTDDYTYKWYKYYAYGINPIVSPSSKATVKEQIAEEKNTVIPKGTMQVTSSITSELSPIFMKKGEVYPFYIEYFNWGGGGKFYFNERFRTQYGSWSSYDHVNLDALYPDVENKPRVPGDSGLDLTVENGVRVIHGYDNFNGDELDTNVWENVSGFSLRDGELVSNGNLSSIKLKKNYKYYDSYEMTIDLVNIANQDLGYSNGGFGISSGDDIWSHNTRMDRGENNSKWYRTYNVTKYGSISASNIYGDTLRPAVDFDEKDNANQSWQNKPIKLEIKAVASDVKDTYDVTTILHYADGGKDKLKEITDSYRVNELDFNNIYLTSIQPVNNWIVAFDNFDFVAKKNLKFDSLKVDWESHKYGLTWDLVPGASGYTVYYQTGIDSSGRPIIHEYPLSNSDKNDVKLGQLYILDISSYCNHPFKVVAHLDEFDMTSNTVYVGGNASNLTLRGSYSGDNYIASWDDLTVTHKDKINNYTYSLFYYNDEDSTLIPVDGAQNMDKSRASHTFVNLQTSSKYYGKYLKLVANADYGDGDIIKYYSNSVKIKSNIRLGISHVNNQYILGWKSENIFNDYKLHRDANPNNYNDKNNITSPYTAVVNTPDNIEKDGYIYIKVADTDDNYINKHYIVGGNDNGDIEYSNIVYAEGDEKVPVLKWLPTSDGHHLFQWDAFLGATDVKLYYGVTADSVDQEFGEDGNLLTSHSFESISSEYDNKYVQVRFLKNGIWHYSNIIRTLEFDDIGGRINKNSLENNQYDFVVDWEDVTWPEDGNDLSKRMSHYQVYYLNDSGDEVLIQTNVKNSNYTIFDIYGTNSEYLNKEIYVKAICPIKDKFGIEYMGTLISPKIIPRKIQFNQLSGILDDDNKYVLTWAKPVKLLGSVEQEITADAYDILYGPTKESIDKKAVSDMINPVELKQEWDDVTKTGSNKEFYHKFFKVKAKIDGVEYLSNTAYSGEKPVLRIDRFNNDFKLNWDAIEHADAIKVYYEKNKGSKEYEFYELVKLNGDAIVYVLEDMINNKMFEGHYNYKISAVFDGFEIKSDPLIIDSTMMKRPILIGEYKANSNSYDTWWEAIDWADDGYQFYYENTQSDDSNVDDSSYIKMPESEYLLNKEITTKQFKDIENNTYNGKYVRIRAINGNFTAYSNAVNPHLPALKGELDGLFGDDRVEIRLSNSVDIIYNFNVYKDMKKPYFKMVLNGSKYLKFDKTSAYLEKTEGGVTKDLPIRLVSEFDEDTGLTTLYAHLLGNAPIFSANNDVDYKLVVSSSIEVNEKRAKDVYQALRDFKANADNWELPYYIIDKQMTVDGNALGENMFIKYEAHWNTDDRDSVGNTRQSSSEMFEIDIYMKNKAKLPSSL